MELLIYAKDGKIKAISFDEAWGDSERLLAEGWEHTHTINPQPSCNSFTTNVKTMMRYSTFNHLDLKTFSKATPLQKG